MWRAMQNNALTMAQRTARTAIVMPEESVNSGMECSKNCSGSIRQYSAIPWASREETTQGTRAA